ncbi:MAG: hypothetical protein GWP19_07975 [Planctomycetia bacterium]|nr:hypothetical protein [Planctomycetia bacterium]
MKEFKVIRTYTREQEQTVEADSIEEAEKKAINNSEDWEDVECVDIASWDYEVEEI